MFRNLEILSVFYVTRVSYSSTPLLFAMVARLVGRLNCDRKVRGVSRPDDGLFSLY